ncbi:MAG: hypothetical protein RQ826_17960 [Xanthomonadales bacterium]|nr:hypothetical protein [Xanthomonadales bacterium]
MQTSQDSNASVLVLAGTPGLDIEPLVALFNAAGFRTGRRKNGNGSAAKPALRVYRKPDALRCAGRMLADQPDTTGLLIYQAPAPCIARSVAEGQDPEQALVGWLQQVEPLLEVYRQARRRILLLERDAALANPVALVSDLNQRLNLSLQAPAGKQNQEAEAEPAFDPVHLLIADRACHQDIRARRAAAELEAGALPLAAPTGVAAIDLSSTFQAYREKSEEPLRKVNGLKEENELLLSQLHQVQTQLKARQSRVRELEQALETQAGKDGAVRTSLEQENERLGGQLNRVQQELESEFLKNREHEKKIKALEGELETLKNDTTRQDELQEENDLLLTQLHQVQEELESIFLKSRENESKINVLEQEAATSKDELNKRKGRIDSLQKEIERLKNDTSRLEALQAEISRLQQDRANWQEQAESLKSKVARQDDLQEENDLLLTQLHQVQEELENYFLQNQDLTRKLKKTEKQEKELERKARQATNMLADVHRSASWRITAPIRLLLRPFLGK